MKSLTIFFSFCFILSISQCLQEEKTTQTNSECPTYDINLSAIQNRYIDLSFYEKDTLSVGGDYTGERIVLKGLSNKFVNFYANVKTTSTDEAIVLWGPNENLKIKFFGTLNNGIHIWDALNNSTVTGLTVIGGKFGVKMNDTIPSHNTTFEYMELKNQQLEAIYIGTYYERPQKYTNIKVENSIIENSGWDGLQIGNCIDCEATNINIISCGDGEDTPEYHSYPITINPGSRVTARNVNVTGTSKISQTLDSRFFESKDYQNNN